MLSIGNKTFMNLQEAVGWLLENNALPFQSSANYVANTEIAMSTLVNPSPAKVRVGSLVFFADSKVSTVIGVTSNSFIVSDQYNNLVDDIAYVTNVEVNASGHLITTLSDGQQIDAGLLKQLSNFNIDASQHLIANYNDGTSTDLGAIFNGNVTITGDFSAKTVSQTQANSKATITWGGVSSALSVDDIFSYVEVINGVLHCIVNVKLTNISGATVSLETVGTGWIFLNNALASALIDLKGNSVATNPVTDTLITATCATFVKNGYDFSAARQKGEMLVYNVPAAYAFAIRFKADSAISMADSDYVLLTARVALVTI